MKIVNTEKLPSPPYELLKQASLFLDFDGTLIEIAERPENVSVSKDIVHLINELLMQLSGRVVIVSGRPASEIKHFLKHTQVFISGSHGAEFIYPNMAFSKSNGIVPKPQIIEKLNRLIKDHPGVWIETKPFGIAIHYRLAPFAEKSCLELARHIAVNDELAIQPGKQVVELKYHTSNKGDAVRASMMIETMKNGIPLFIGDDLTDEAGFEAAAEFGGAGILVGPERQTRALYSLPDVKSLRTWLRRASMSDNL